MRTIGNILWLLLGGLPMAIGYTFAGLLMFVFVITIPFGVQAFKLAGFALWPFGRVMVDIPRRSAGLSTIGNILWLVFGGLWLAIGHLVSALLLAVTIIGIPFALAQVKMAGAALTPFGRTVVSREGANARYGAVVISVEPLRR